MTIALAENNTNIAPVEDLEIKNMIDAGVHFGHSKTKRHPAMEPYIWTVRSGISIIDVMKTKEKLLVALDFLKTVASKNGIILFVGTRPAAKKIIREKADLLGMPYVNERWIGGTLTNFKVIAKRVGDLQSLEQEQSSGGFEKYTKKERLEREREIERLKISFGGLRLLQRLPDALLVVNILHDDTAVREAQRLHIPTVALVDTNANPRLVTYPIPSNDDAPPAVRYMLERMHQAFQEGKHEAVMPQDKSQT